MRTVTVLLSTYNGEKYLKEQIDSILGQKNVKVKLIIRDDGSNDNTKLVLDQYKNNNMIKIYFEENVGVGKSFWKLLSLAEKSEYYAFCDQDDVWQSNKLFVAIEKLKANENIPALYCSNTKLVDSNLNYIKTTNLDNGKIRAIGSVMIQNHAIGCTTVFNRLLLDNLLRLPCKELKNGIIHDSIAYKLCYAIGKVVFDKNSYILYRQHTDNAIGVPSNIIKKIFTRLKTMKKQFNFNIRSKTAMLIIKYYGDNIDKNKIEQISKVAYYNNSFMNKLKLLFDLKIRRDKIMDDFLYRIAILLGKV